MRFSINPNHGSIFVARTILNSFLEVRRDLASVL